MVEDITCNKIDMEGPGRIAACLKPCQKIIKYILMLAHPHIHSLMGHII